MKTQSIRLVDSYHNPLGISIDVPLSANIAISPYNISLCSVENIADTMGGLDGFLGFIEYSTLEQIFTKEELEEMGLYSSQHYKKEELDIPQWEIECEEYKDEKKTLLIIKSFKGFPFYSESVRLKGYREENQAYLHYNGISDLIIYERNGQIHTLSVNKEISKTRFDELSHDIRNARERYILCRQIEYQNQKEDIQQNNVTFVF